MREYDVQGSRRPARSGRPGREKRNRTVAVIVLIAVAAVLILMGVAVGSTKNGDQPYSVQFRVLPLTPDTVGTANAAGQ